LVKTTSYKVEVTSSNPPSLSCVDMSKRKKKKKKEGNEPSQSPCYSSTANAYTFTELIAVDYSRHMVTSKDGANRTNGGDQPLYFF
jgi:hypothetical protein